MSMPSVEASQGELRERLIEIVRATPPLMQVLLVARHLRLPHWLVFSGAVYQPVLNHLTGRPLDFGIKDYDLGYFDASDISYEAEDEVIRQVRAAFDEPLWAWSRFATKRACISGLRQSSVNRTARSHARLKH
jgi:hypothetical protein